MRAAFFGSPAFAVPCLDVLHEIADVVAVFSQPDRPSGRGLALTPPAVKSRALELGLPVHQPIKVRSGALAAQLEELALDVAVVVAYGRILPRAVLDAPARGCVNVHGSLLPKWRGAAPIQWAIANGDATTGVTLMRMDEGMDTGPMIATTTTPIDPDETTPELAERLSLLGAALLRAELPRWVREEVEAKPQPEGATHAELLSKEHGQLDWTASARALHDRVRAFVPWPGTTTDAEGVRLKVHRTHVVAARGTYGQPGTVLPGVGLQVACGEGILGIDELQEPNRKRLDAESFRAGRELPPRLGVSSDEGTA